MKVKNCSVISPLGSLMRKKLQLSILCLILLSFILITSSRAYTENGGIEDGDRVNMAYQLKVDNVIQQSNDNFTTDITKSNLINGFYYGVLGMKVGQQKTITVPPDQGYTDPKNKFYNKTLIFDVLIKSIVSNVRGNPSGVSNIADTLQTIFKIVIVLVSTVVLGFIFIRIRTRTTTPICPHCKYLKSQNPDYKPKLSEGYCGKCGSKFCRSAFVRGCPNCKANKFIPFGSKAE